MKTVTTILALLLFGLLQPALAQGAKNLEVSFARAVPTIGDMRHSAAYLDLTNNGPKTVELRSVHCPLAEVAEVHAYAMDADVIRMRKIDTVSIAPGEKLQLRPGAHHVMLMGLKQPLNPGETVPLTLEFTGGEMLEFSVPVKEPDPASAPGEGHEHHHPADHNEED